MGQSRFYQRFPTELDFPQAATSKNDDAQVLRKLFDSDADGAAVCGFGAPTQLLTLGLETNPIQTQCMFNGYILVIVIRGTYKTTGISP